MIGAKTAAAVVSMAIALVVAGARGVLDPAYLAGLGPATGVVIGLFASVAVALVALGWRPERPSHLYVGSPRSARLIEAPAFVQRAALAVVFLCVGLTAFGNTEAARLAAVDDELAGFTLYEYCEDEGRRATATEESSDPEPPQPRRGCALIQRAHDLGYTDDLGDCAPEQVEERVEEAEQASRPCQLRQPDEPALHYAWRLLSGRLGELSEPDPVERIRRDVDEVEIKLGYVGSLLARHTHAIAATPRASHHLWIDLPPPRRSSWLAGLLSDRDCASRHAGMPVRIRWLDESSPTSALVEHALGHMLFNPAFGEAVGNCDEYHLHWDAPADACDRLAADPEGVLDEAGALEPVRAVLDRRRQKRELRRLQTDLGLEPAGRPPPDPEQIVSFSCLSVASDAGGEVAAMTASVDGVTLPVRALGAGSIEPAGAAQIDVYEHLAALLAGGHYGGPVSEGSLARVAARPPEPDDVTGGDGFALARLERLRHADPFVGVGWPLERDDLADVYPLHLHLRNFVAWFRRSYSMQRGRL